jgi:hypothetical protein
MCNFTKWSLIEVKTMVNLKLERRVSEIISDSIITII